MKRLLIALVLIPLLSSGQNDFQTLYYALLANQGNSTIQEALIDSFFLAHPETPYVSGDSAVFLHRGSATSVQVAGDFNSWNPSGNDLFPIGGSTLKYRSLSFEPTARLDYKLIVSGNWVLDPLNPHTAPGGFGSNSELAMPQYVQPWEIVAEPSVPSGTVITHSINSTNTNKTYPVHVYLPPNYDSTQTYPTVYFQDGTEYRLLGSAPTVLDNLIAADSIQPVIGVFVTPTNRNDEYAFALRDAYTAFFAQELVPYIDGMYSTITGPWGRMVLGDSFGGNISALIAFQHEEVFGNVGFHSGAFWPDDFHTLDVIAQSDADNIRVAMVWGTYESVKYYNRTLRDSLIQEGFPVHWGEYYEGHSWGLWRATLDELIDFAFPLDELSTPEEVLGPEVTTFPNPFADSVRFRVEHSSDRPTSIRLYSTEGKLAMMVNLPRSAWSLGEYELSTGALPAGMYFAEFTWPSGEKRTIRILKQAL